MIWMSRFPFSQGCNRFVVLRFELSMVENKCHLIMIGRVKDDDLTD